ncbi:MAG: hypothetical protein LLG14_16855 [Nocardiaceae bacterium]|nr:hypothetical protein [Nocardiaceae bacterium]
MTTALTPDVGSSGVSAGSDIAPLLGKPVEEVLALLGLPPLPTPDQAVPPGPGMPTLPPLDLVSLFKPLTDLLAGFGSGDLSQAALDPRQAFGRVQQTLQSTEQTGGSAMSALAPAWTGPGADAAMASGTSAQADGVSTAAQSQSISTSLSLASASVAKGRLGVEGVIASLSAIVTASAPFILTPPGQAAILSAASSHLAQATAITAETRTEMTGHTAAMAGAGIPVPISMAPQILGQLSQLGSTLLGSSAKQGKARGSLMSAGRGVLSKGKSAAELAGRSRGVKVPVALGMLPGSASGGPGSQVPGARTATLAGDPRASLPTVDQLRTDASGNNTTSTKGSLTSPTAAPAAGPGGFHGAAVSKNVVGDRGHLATGSEEMVGDIPAVTPSVVGSGPLNLAVEASREPESRKTPQRNSLDL